MAVQRHKENTEIFAGVKYVYVPGPVNSAICYVASMPGPVGAISCFTSSCMIGSTLAVWALVPPVLNWTATGNVTLIKYGKLEISFGLVNDRRNGTTKPIPSLMFSVANSIEKCPWVSMIYGHMITNAWAHIVVTIDKTGSLKVFLNGKANQLMKETTCLPPPANLTNFVSSKLNFTCFDEFTVWNKLLSQEEIEQLYNATVYGGNSLITVTNSVIIVKHSAIC